MVDERIWFTLLASNLLSAMGCGLIFWLVGTPRDGVVAFLAVLTYFLATLLFNYKVVGQALRLDGVLRRKI